MKITRSCLTLISLSVQERVVPPATKTIARALLRIVEAHPSTAIPVLYRSILILTAAG